MPGAAATLGVLVAIACVGSGDRMRPAPCLVTSLAAGILMLPFLYSTVPSFSRWTMPLGHPLPGVRQLLFPEPATDRLRGKKFPTIHRKGVKNDHSYPVNPWGTHR